MRPILFEIVDRFIAFISRSMTLAGWFFAFILLNVKGLLRLTAMRYPLFKARLGEMDFTAQIRTRENPMGRYFTFRDGRVISRSGIHPRPDMTIIYQDAALGARLMTPWRSQLEQVNAMKNFKLGIEGPDELTSWFMETLSIMLSAGMKFGTDMRNGLKRYVNGTNGGPVFVYVKDGKIVRITPIDFDKDDAGPWTIEARGRKFTPPRRTTLSPYSLSWKSMVYSPNRLLYPMKRADFDPKGDRNCQNRGVSGYERISWDEALEIVAGEIKRVKKDYGPGAMMSGSGSHHNWGCLGYWLSTRLRFMNLVGFTPVVSNPDS